MKNKNKISLFKKIIKTLPALFGSVALVYGVLLVKDIELPEIFPVENVQVIGELNFLDKRIIESVVSDNIEGGYFTVDLNKIRQALKQQPWIQDVSLRRQWPAQLDVFIAEQVPVAYWNDDAYINDDGEVFSPEMIDESLNLLKLTGPDGSQNTVWKFMNKLHQQIALLEFEVVRLDLDDRRSWQLLIVENASSEISSSEISKQAMSADEAKVNKADMADSNMIDIKLGRFETEKRLQRFVRVLPLLTIEQKINSNDSTGKKIKVIDMRYPNGFAVQMTTVNTMPDQAATTQVKGA